MLTAAMLTGTGKEKNWRINKPTNMEKATELLHGHFHFKVLPDGAVDRTKVICNHCKVEFSYHRSTSSLKYHLNAIHTVDTSKSFNETNSGARLRQTTLDAAFGRSIDKQRQEKLNAIATDCRPCCGGRHSEKHSENGNK